MTSQRRDTGESKTVCLVAGVRDLATNRHHRRELHQHGQMDRGAEHE